MKKTLLMFVLITIMLLSFSITYGQQKASSLKKVYTEAEMEKMGIDFDQLVIQRQMQEKKEFGLAKSTMLTKSFKLTMTNDETADVRVSGYVRGLYGGCDLDQDGKKEVVFPSYESSADGARIFVYEVTGDDQWEYVWSSPAIDTDYSSPRTVTVGDLDGDGKYEIITMFSRSITDANLALYVYEWDGSTDNGYGTEPVLKTQLTEFGVTSRLHAESIVVYDLDSDGKQEMIVAQNGLSAEDFYLIFNVQGDMAVGGFASLQQEAKFGRADYGGGSPLTVTVCDTDGDGKKELFCTAWDNLRVFVIEATAADTYVISNNLTLGSGNDDLVIKDPEAVDADGDGKDEIYFAAYKDARLWVFDNTADASAIVSTDFHTLADGGGPSIDWAIGDLDNNGKIEIYGTGYPGLDVVAYELTGTDIKDPSSYTVYAVYDDNNKGNGASQPIYVPSSDLDGDGYTELIVGYVSISDSLEEISGTDTTMIINPHPAQWIRVLEFNATTPPSKSYKLAMTNDEDAAVPVNGYVRGLYAGCDLDQDGKKEVIFPSYESSTDGARLFVYEVTADNQMEYVWSSPAIDTDYSSPRTVAVGDLDGDGKYEIITMFSRSITDANLALYVYEWDGSTDNGYGTEPVLKTQLSEFGVTSRLHAESIIVNDLDGDGKQEMIIAQNGLSAEDFFLIFNVSGDMAVGGFASLQQEAKFGRADYGGGSPLTATVCDTDGDGNKELFCTAWDNLRVFVIEATGADTYVISNNLTLGSGNDDLVIKDPEAVDADGDGKDEIYFAAYKDARLFVFDNTADASAIVSTDFHTLADGGGPSIDWAIGDLDKNGKIEIYGTGFPGLDVVSYEFTGTTVTDSNSYTVNTVYDDNNAGNGASQPIFVPATDLDGDGNVELIVGYVSISDSTERVIGTDTIKVANPHPKSWVRVLEYDGAVATGIKDQQWTVITPNDFKLKQNYPNPFNPTTTIEYYLPVQRKVKVRIYNMLGQLVRTLVNDKVFAEGNHKVMWDSRNEGGIRVASGTYIYTLEFDNYRISKKLTLLK